MLKDQLHEVQRNIEEACRRSKRDPREVTLIAVSKTKPASMVEELLPEGIRDFGENKPQELRDKYQILPKDLRWHMIGHLQTNKIKYIIDKACMIHSVDSLHLAQAIDREAEKHNLVMPVLVEVNVAGEETKFGVSPEETLSFVEKLSHFSHIRVNGLMTIAPFVDNPEDNRIHFRNLRNLCVDIKDKNIDNVNMCTLSMGMTGDYQVAVEEGSTMVRVGTAIFGARDYQI